jgi:N-glycosylase/DNA lyase
MTRDRRRRELLSLYEERKDAIRARLAEFHRVRSSEYLYELLYCLLTPQTKAEHAEAAVSKLRSLSFDTQPIDPEPILADRAHYIRFHKTKAQHLVRIKQTMEQISERLANGASSFELREWLVKNVKGFGYKEATHFLRNIGKNDGLAILDRHILRNLKRYGVIRSLPTSLSRKRYLAIERRFKQFADELGIPVDALDLLFWSMETGEIRK